MAEEFVLTVPAEIDRLSDVLSFIDAQLEDAGCPLKTQIQIDVAVEELFVNIAHYAYPSDKGDASIRVITDRENGVIVIEFRDHGIPFDPVAVSDPDVTLSAEERRIGGLGIFMAKKNMDEMRYLRENGQNILTVTKKL